MAFCLFVLFWQYVREAKIPAMKLSKSVPGSWILLPASFSEKQKRRSRARSSPYPQVLPNTCLPLERSYYKLSDAASTRVTSTGPSGGRDRQAASGSDNGRQSPFTISSSSLLPACEPSHPPESLLISSWWQANVGGDAGSDFLRGTLIACVLHNCFKYQICR